MTNPREPFPPQSAPHGTPHVASSGAPAASVEAGVPHPATGSASPNATELTKEQEPTVTGTLFLMAVFLMMIAGFWTMMYDMLIHR